MRNFFMRLEDLITKFFALSFWKPFRTLFAATIWAPDAIPADEWKYRNLKRVMYPVIDLFFILSGLSAARFGIPAITIFFPDWFVDLFAYILSFVAFLCLLGVSFPSQWKLEIFGKGVLVGLMVGYTTSLLILTGQGEDNRGFILFIAAVALCPVVWRLSLLGSEWQVRRIQKKTDEEHNADIRARGESYE